MFVCLSASGTTSIAVCLRMERVSMHVHGMPVVIHACGGRSGTVYRLACISEHSAGNMMGDWLSFLCFFFLNADYMVF